MRKISERIIFLTTYLFGILIGALFHFLVFLKRIKIFYWNRFPRWQKKLILVSNHPSLLEPILLPALFFQEYVFRPREYGPWSTPDKKNYFDRWWCYRLVGARSIPVNRGNILEEMRALVQMRKILQSGGRIILFPEGGRTFRGTEFLYSQKGRIIRKLKEGIGWLVLKTGAMVLPVWVDGADEVLPDGALFPRVRERLRIKIGHPLVFNEPFNNQKEEITQKISNALLKLADEGE